MVTRILASVVLPALAIGLVAARPQQPYVVSGRLHTADFGNAGGARVYLGAAGTRDSTTADGEGRFSLEVGTPPEGSIELAVAAGDLPVPYFPVRLELKPGAPAADLALILVPRRWTVYAGVHAGTVVEIDLRGATRRPCGSCAPFYRDPQGESRPGPRPGIPTWPDRAYPLRVAFDTIHGQRVAPRDSAVFWGIARDLEGYLGRPLWRAAGLDEVLEPIDEDPRGSLLVFLDASLRTTGLGSTAAQGGDILAGAVHFQRASLFSGPGGPGLVSHELVHALGFGHTCSWRSLVAHPDHCRRLSSPIPTPQDVAHIQLLWRIRSLERSLGTAGTVSAALAASALRSSPAPLPAPGAAP